MEALTARLEALEREMESRCTAEDELRAENQELRAAKEASDLRFRAWRRLTGLFMGLTAVMFGLLLTPLAPATAQTTQATLEERVAALEFKLHYVSRVGREMVFNAVNVHIRNGGRTTESVNGLGNLIVGFNERRGDGTDNRTGSHNLIVGTRNNYSSYGSLVAGFWNSVSSGHASVSGGSGNTASGYFSSVSGGSSETASGENDWRAGGLFQEQ